MKSMQSTENDIKKALDQHVKEMHNLLRDLDPQQRLEYIKEMLPGLLSFSHPTPVSARQKLEEQMRTPVENLTKRELDLINDLAKKTEGLYKAMNDGSFFG
jgi:hypothetical protein